jgi:hypothetical protein
MRSAANSLEQCVLFLPGTFVRFGVFWVSLRGGPSFWFEARGVDLALCPTIDTDPK